MERHKYIDISINNFSKICRVCLSPSDIPVISIDSLDLYIKFTNIQVKQDDLLPKNICKACGVELRNIGSFIEKCIDTDKFLTSVLEHSIQNSSSPIHDPPNYESDFPDPYPYDEFTVKLENGNSCNDFKPDIKSESGLTNSELNSESTVIKNFHCANCGKGFTAKRELIIHMKSHSGARPFTCSVCNMKFKLRYSLQRHRLIHSSLKAYDCDICGKGFKRVFSRNKHRKIHNRVKRLSGADSKYNCTQCDRILASHSALSNHMKTHTGEKPYSCSYCGKCFSYVSSLTVHTRLHTGETPFVCPICNKGYRSSTSLKKHREVKHYDIEEVIQDENSEDRNEDKDLDKRECKICRKVLNKHGFGTHMRIHTVEKKQFVCTFCDKSFQKNSHLERHIRIHTGERPYICTLCNKTFKQDGDLKRHVLTHTGEKQFQCQHCGKQYYTKGSLDTHMAVHTGVKRPVNYDCNICNKSFRQCTHFKTHMNSHTGEKPYLCTICGKSFTASGTLKVHTRIHTGETPFVCSYCSKGYNNSTSLKRHIMCNHTGEKPYVCMICHKGFHDSTNLKRHVKRVHSVVEIKRDNETQEIAKPVLF